MLQLEDLVANYPPADTPGIQTIMSAKREFIEVGALPEEPAPVPGETFYNNQQFLLRYMIPNDRLLVNWQTGTGKTCGLGLLAEYYHDLYLRDPENAPIKRTIVLTPGPGLRDDLRLQIACRCTKGQYITKNVLEATRLQTQKGNLTRDVGKWYTIDTYKRFILPLEKLSDEEIRRRYSRTIIFIDEAHNLNVSGKGEKETRKQIVYQQLWRLLHLVEGCKIILATATPMVNETKEIGPLMNLLLAADQQLPADLDFNTVSLEEMEPYFRGKISFVRALDTGINVILEGEPHGVVINTPEGDIETTIIAKTSVMGDIQLEGYLRAQEMRSGVYDNERQASNCVFPDGSWGGTFPREVKEPKRTATRKGERVPTIAELIERARATGLGHYVISPSPDNYRPTDEFREWLRIVDDPEPDEPHLGRIACKYETSVREVLNGTLGTVFVYNDFVFGSGAIVQGLAFEVNGFERYKGDVPAFQDVSGATLAHPCSGRAGARRILIDKRPRYALITSETSAANVSRILDLFSSPENIHGEYLKVLIGSQIAREGLNLSHGTQIHLTTTWWNRSANYQAISRAIRATSHILLLNEEKRRLEAEKERLLQEGNVEAAEAIDPKTAVIPVQIFQHAALPNEGEFEESVDIFMYELADKKDYDIRRMERIMKQIAIDCWLHYARNVRATDVDYSPTCDYAPCEYQCFDPEPTQLDLETYDVYYINETLDKAANRINDLFSSNFSLLRTEIYALLDEFRPVEIDRALTKIMADKRIIYDRYGFLSYLREDGDRFFLQRDFPLSAASEGSQALEIYTSNLIASREISLPTYLSWLDADFQNEVIQEILVLPEDSPDLEAGIEALNSEGRIALLEEAVYNYVIGPATPSLRRVIEYFTNLLYILYEPGQSIEMIEEMLTQRGKGRGRGRPPKGGGRQRAIKLTPDDLQEDIEEIPLEEIPLLMTEGTDREVVFLHTLYNTIFDRVSYNVSTRFKKGDGRLRIFKPSEGVGWRDAKPTEIPVYGAVVEAIRTRRVAPFEDFDIYGTLLQDNKFRIRDKTTERTRQQQGAEREDARFNKRGRVCKTFDKADLINILWKLNVDAPPAKRRLPTDPEELVDYLTRKKIIKADDDLADWDEERLEYYARWESFGSRAKICDEIQRFFTENGRLLTV